MTNFVIRPKADGNFDNAVFFTGTTPVTATGLTNGTEYEAAVISLFSAGFTPFAAASHNYVENIAELDVASIAGNESAFTASFNLIPQVVDNTEVMFVVSGRSQIQKASAGLRLILKDTANTTVLDTTIPSVFAVDVAANIYVAANFATGVLVVEVDGVDVTPAGFSGGSGLVDLDRPITIFESGLGTKSQFSSVFIDNSIIANSAIYNGGADADLAALSPLVLFGESMVAADWNAGNGLGSVTGFTVTGTFTDVP